MKHSYVIKFVLPEFRIRIPCWSQNTCHPLNPEPSLQKTHKSFRLATALLLEGVLNGIFQTFKFSQVVEGRREKFVLQKRAPRWKISVASLSLSLHFAFQQHYALPIYVYQISILPPTDPTTLLYVAYYVTTLLQVAMFCFCRDEITAAASGVHNELYNLYDPQESINITKALILMLGRCQKPLILKAGKLVSLSVGTLAHVMRTSFSYYAVIRSLCEKRGV